MPLLVPSGWEAWCGTTRDTSVWTRTPWTCLLSLLPPFLLLLPTLTSHWTTLRLRLPASTTTKSSSSDQLDFSTMIEKAYAAVAKLTFLPNATPHQHNQQRHTLILNQLSCKSKITNTTKFCMTCSRFLSMIHKSRTKWAGLKRPKVCKLSCI